MTLLRKYEGPLAVAVFFAVVYAVTSAYERELGALNATLANEYPWVYPACLGLLILQWILRLAWVADRQQRRKEQLEER